MHLGTIGRLAGILTLVTTVCMAPVRADSLTLRSGGELRGELVTPIKGTQLPDLLTIRTLTGGTISVAGSEVAGFVRRRRLLEDYETLRRGTPDTLSAQWELAEWCRQKSLPRERETHLQRVVVLDPDHAAAHRALGHIRDKKTGAWTTQAELMAARGYVRHKGRYVLPQELDLIQQEAQASETEKAWFRKVRVWQNWLDSDRAERQSEALTQLREIHEPEAVPALVRYFKGVSQADRRLMLVQILSRIEGDRPVSPLVLQSLWDESEEVRETAVEGLQTREFKKVLPYYLRALKNRTNTVVNHAGEALGRLGNETVIPQLIDALVTRHVYTWVVADPVPGISTSGNMVPEGQVPLPAQIEGQIATGQLFGAVVEAPFAPQRTKEVTYEKDEENAAVLQALQTLTGEDFGFDEPAWRRWFNGHKNAAAAGKVKKSRP